MMYLIVGLCTPFAGAQSQDHIVKRQSTASNTLQHYIQLRLDGADWRDYSNYITWTDEPSWDCNWVVGHYTIGVGQKETDGITIPVHYKRLGLFCYDFDFKEKSSEVTVNYGLIRSENRWKVNAPIPDYPDIGAKTLISLMETSAKNVQESQDRRRQFTVTAQMITAALSSMKER